MRHEVKQALHSVLLEQKYARYEEYRRLKNEHSELQTVRRNVDEILRVELPDRQREQERGADSQKVVFSNWHASVLFSIRRMHSHPGTECSR